NHPCAVDQDLHRAQFRLDGIGTAPKGFLIGHSDYPGTAVNLACKGMHAIIPVEQGDARAARCQLPATRRADAASAAGDHSDTRQGSDGHLLYPCFQEANYVKFVPAMIVSTPAVRAPDSGSSAG